MRLRYGQGLAFADDFAYVNAALDANERGWGPFIAGVSSIYENRLSIVLPLAAFQQLFGRTELALQLLGLCFSCAAIAVAFAIGRDLAGERAGWLSALLIAAIPQDIWYGTSLLPDSVTPFYTAMALYATLLAQKRQLAGKGVLLYALAALFVLLAFEARATGGVILLPLGVWGLLQPGQRLVRAALPGLLFAAMLASLWGVLWLSTGDPAIQIRQLVHDGTGTAWTGTGKPFQHLFTMLPVVRLLVELPDVIHGTAPQGASGLARYGVNTYLGLHYYLVWPAVVWAILRERRVPAVRYPLTAFLALYLFFEFGSTSLTSYQPIWKYERFLTILGVPSAVLAGVVAAHLSAQGAWPAWTQRALPAALAVHIALSAALLEANTRFWGAPVAAVKTTFHRLKSLETADTVYVVDSQWELWGRAMMRLEPSKRYRFALLSDDLARVRKAVVIMDWSYFDGSSKHRLSRSGFDPRLFQVDARPATWRRLFDVEASQRSWQKSLIEVLAAP